MISGTKRKREAPTKEQEEAEVDDEEEEQEEEEGEEYLVIRIQDPRKGRAKKVCANNSSRCTA
jgi:hypothetical protein